MTTISPALLMAEAERKAGFSGIDDPDFPRRLELVVDKLFEAKVPEDRYPDAIDQISDVIAERLRMERDRQEHPEIAAQQIERPLIVSGFARSGTTMLHALLAEDPSSRAPLNWEGHYPSPPPALAPEHDDRVERATSEGQESRKRQPGTLQAHPYSDAGGLALTECESFFATDLRNTFPPFFWKIPAFRLVGPDGEPIPPRPQCTDYIANYGWHKKFLQHLQWGGPDKRWVLKGTEHHYHLSELKATYPDAMIVWPHRDLLSVLPSLLELLARINEGIVGKVNRPAMGASVLNGIRTQLTAALENPLIDDPSVFHLPYTRTMADPVAAIRSVYEHFDLPWTDEHGRRILAWPDANPAGRYGKFEYSLEDFDLDADELYERFRDYYERFGIERER
jgi:hypothetical protein